jgi:cytochrome c oxidase subunit 2
MVVLVKRVMGLGCWVLGLAFAAGPPVKVVHMTAERFSFTPSQIKVKVGTVVEFRIASEDTNHGFRIAEAGINEVIPKRGKGELKVRFTAEKPGRYEFECSKPCGAGHNMMRGVVIVE